MDEKNLSTVTAREAKTQEVRAFAEGMREHLVAAINAGGDTDRKVASMLNKQKLRTRTGERWTFGGVKYLRMLLGIARQSPKQPALMKLTATPFPSQSESAEARGKRLGNAQSSENLRDNVANGRKLLG